MKKYSIRAIEKNGKYLVYNHTRGNRKKLTTVPTKAAAIAAVKDYILNTIEVNVTYTGSKGNCVPYRFGRTVVLMDCGITIKAFKQMMEDMVIERVDVLFITHTHRDHVNDALFKYIKKTYPDIMIIGRKTEKRQLPGGIKYKSYINDHYDHDMTNSKSLGVIFNYKGFKVNHGTDMGNTNAVPKIKCDKYVFEVNYDNATHKAQTNAGLRPLSVMKRGAKSHLGLEQCLDFIDDVEQIVGNWLGKLVPIHMSEHNLDIKYKERLGVHRRIFLWRVDK